MKESVIQKAVLDWLEMYSRTHKIYFFRAGSGAVRMANGRYFKTGKPGVSDIIVCHHGRMVGLEIKTKTGRQSQAQKKAEKEIKESGGDYYIIRNLSDVKRIFPA